MDKYKNKTINIKLRLYKDIQNRGDIMNKLKSALGLFIQFFKFGCFTFGGGWSIVAQMQKLYVEKEQILTNDEILDLTSVGRSVPGTMIGNIAMLFGYRQAGYIGGVACVTGLVLPPMIILSVITHFYTLFRDSYWVTAAMSGVTAAVVPIILSAAIPLMKGAFRIKPCIIVAILSLILYLFYDVSCIWLVIGGAFSGILISEYKERNTIQS